MSTDNNTKKLMPFHLAIPVLDLKETRTFYNTVLDCKEGRSSDHWVDLDFYGHQLVLHITAKNEENHSNPVDGYDVPIPNFWSCLNAGRLERFSRPTKRTRNEFHY